VASVPNILASLEQQPNITSGDTGLRAQAERQAVNTIIQVGHPPNAIRIFIGIFPCFLSFV
jgi:DNA polymerase I-like protein with 3'-5' exonuclease and polymerase domains